MTDIFISYNQDDRDKAKVLAELLVKSGYDVWWDVSLLPGQNFVDEINSIISESKVTVVLWTEKSVSSMWVKSEATLALEKSKLIPVWLEKIDLPIPFNNLHTLDLSHWEGRLDDCLLDSLIISIKNSIGGAIIELEEYSEEKIDELLEKPAHEVEFWKSICSHESPTVKEYEAYLKTYGEAGIFSKLAHLRIEQINSEKKSSKIGARLNKGLLLSGVVLGMLVGIFQIADMMGWLPLGEANAKKPVASNLRKKALDKSCKTIFENTCGKGACTSLRLPDFVGENLPKKKLDCDEKCIKEYEEILLKNHISYLSPSGGASAKYSWCVGFREDLGGTYKGAECLISLLGKGFKVGNCKADGWPYNIYLY